MIKQFIDYLARLNFAPPLAPFLESSAYKNIQDLIKNMLVDN